VEVCCVASLWGIRTDISNLLFVDNTLLFCGANPN
jgi:hypothetical protein